MILRHGWISDTEKGFVNMMIQSGNAALGQTNVATESFQSSVAPNMPPWFAAFTASSNLTVHGSTPDSNGMLDRIQLSMNETHSDNDVHEKLRLFHVGHICAEQQRFVDALNHWEEAVEIKSYIPWSIGRIFDGAIYMQMAAAYFRLNNVSETLAVMEKAKHSMEVYYPVSHRMFGGFKFLYGYYLMQNGEHSTAIRYLQEALRNPYFVLNGDFQGAIHTLMAVSYISLCDFDRAEECCKQVVHSRSSNFVTTFVPNLQVMIPKLRNILQGQDPERCRQFVRNGMQFGQQLLSVASPNLNEPTRTVDEQICTCDEFIHVADYCRHRADHARAEDYYSKALQTMTESDSKQLWNIYRKMMRMKTGNIEQYRDCFIEQYSKYDNDDTAHSGIVETLQIILHRLCLDQDQSELAFDWLVQSVLTTIKSFYYEISVAGMPMSAILDCLFHQEQLMKVIPILTALIRMYSGHLQQLLSQYLTSNELARIFHHPQLDEMISNYEQDRSLEPVVLFLRSVVQLLRQSTTPPEPSNLSLQEQILQAGVEFNDQDTSLSLSMKIAESFLERDTPHFLLHLNRLQRIIVTFDNYRELKENIASFFEALDEDALFACLTSIAENH